MEASQPGCGHCWAQFFVGQEFPYLILNFSAWLQVCSKVILGVGICYYGCQIQSKMGAGLLV